MKAKLKGANGFVRFLLQHGEKIGIAAILLVAGLLVYSSLGRPVVDDTRQPPALLSEANAAKANVDGKTWDAMPPEEQTSFAKFDARSDDGVMSPVNPFEYPIFERPINPPTIDPIKLREDPVLVAAADLEVQPGAGLWMSGDPEAIRENMRRAAAEAARQRREAEEEARRMEEEAEGPRRGRGGPRGGFGEEGRGGMGMMGGDMSGMKTKDGVLVLPPSGGAQAQGFEEFVEQSWVTVLAKIPFKQQIQMYEDALASARGFNATVDLPQYIGYEVERAEVTEEGTGKFTLLKRVLPKTILTEIATYPIQPIDPVNPKYIHPLLTHPLPPLVMREWGEEVTHTDLPLPTPEELMGGAELEGVQPEEPAEEAGNPDDPFASAARSRMQPGAVPGRMDMAMGRPGMAMGRPPMPVGRPGGGGRSMEMGMPMGRGMMGMGADGPDSLGEYTWDGVTKSLLFRFFDDTVEPGHRYRYRVRLVLRDVNANQPARYLDPKVTARQTKENRNWRATEWSDPSPVAVVPRPGLTYIAQTKNVNSLQPEARLIVKSVSKAEAAEIGTDQWYTRGAVLNFAQKAKIIWSSLYKVNQDQPEDSPTFRFLTGLTLVDVDGGDQLVSKNRNLMAPARTLMMDSAGRLTMQNEIDQSRIIREYDYILQQDAEATRRARASEDDRGRGPRGGGRGPRGGF
jgi:hypothetical protein